MLLYIFVNRAPFKPALLNWILCINKNKNSGTSILDSSIWYAPDQPRLFVALSPVNHDTAPEQCPHVLWHNESP